MFVPESLIILVPWCTSVPFTIYCPQNHVVSSNESGEIARILLRLQWLADLSCCWYLGAPPFRQRFLAKIIHLHDLCLIICHIKSINWLQNFWNQITFDYIWFEPCFVSRVKDVQLFVQSIWFNYMRLIKEDSHAMLEPMVLRIPLVESWTLPAKIAPSTLLKKPHQSCRR